jgi:hypothetical protein
MGQKRQ